MLTLLMIADDFTGALDTGVQFASYGANTRVVTGANYDFGQADPKVQVLVIDAETRHLSSEEAYDIVYDITKRAAAQKIPYLFKKTDSALRGNVGSELTAMLEAAGGKTLSFLPAFPKMNRITKEGILYIDGIPVNESVFGKDPFEPVTCSNILQIIGNQSQVMVSVKTYKNHIIPEKERGEEKQMKPEVQVWDAETDEELEALGQYLYETDQMYLTAGCAGFAAVLPGLLGLKRAVRPEIKLTSKLLVICGSMNPITVAQLDYAEEHGFLRIRLKPEERLKQEFWTSTLGQEKLFKWKELLDQHSCVILDSNDLPGQVDTRDYAKSHGLSLSETRVRIAASYGSILNALLEGGLESTLMMIGGDTLLGCMEQLGVREMEPVCELEPGTVLSKFCLQEKKNQVISKSGGFGAETLLIDLACKILNMEDNNMQYAKLQQLTWDGTIYENGDMGTLEALLPTGGYPTAHSPALLELPSGDLLCCWFAGTYEGSADIHIICSILPNDGPVWLPPVDISGDPTCSEQNPSLFYGPDHAVWAMYTAQLDRQEGKDNMQYTAVVRCQKSTDGGKTWGPYETVFPEEGTFCRQPIQILSNGRFIFSNWLCTDSVDGLSGDPTAFRISDDEGKTWRMVMMPKSNGHVHANVIELENGHLVAFMRNREAYRIHRSESFDWGETWSEPVPSPLPNNNSSISAVKLQSGRIAIAYNPTCSPDPQPVKAAWPGLRCPVAVAFSEDGGLTFPIVRWMERGEGFMGDENKTNNKQYEYPYLMQSRDGKLHLAYASHTRQGVKYVRFSEQDVLGSKRERVGLYNPTAAQSH